MGEQDESGRVATWTKEQWRSQSMGAWIRDGAVMLGVAFMILRPATEHARMEGKMDERVLRIESAMVERIGNLTDSVQINNGVLNRIVSGVSGRHVQDRLGAVSATCHVDLRGVDCGQTVSAVLSPRQNHLGV